MRKSMKKMWKTMEYILNYTMGRKSYIKNGLNANVNVSEVQQIMQKGVGKFGKPKLKREDFMFENGWFDSHTKMPASLSMQQFQISDCEHSTIFIFDSNAGVYIDDCKYSCIFIGPSESSIFVRDCHYLTIICCTKQFRVRDSTHCNIMLWCQSQPIIESSYALSFRCFPELAYDDLGKQFKQAGLSSVWDNNWFDIYDFTPGKFLEERTGEPNHRCISEHELGDKAQSQNEKFISMCREKIQENKLGLTRDLFPRCLSAKGVGIDDYFVILAAPVPAIGLGLHTLHSRVGPCPAQLSQKYGKNPQILFSKIVPAWLGKWQRQLGTSLVGILRSHHEKQLIESTIFLPFGDEH